MEIKKGFTVLALIGLVSCMQAERVSLDTSGTEGLVLGTLSVELGLFGGSSGAGAGPTVVIGGLTWQRCAYGQTWTGSTCTGSATGVLICSTAVPVTPCNTSGNPISSGPAFDVCNNLVLGGYSDWRLPSVGELLGIVYCSAGRSSTSTASSCDPGYSTPTINTSLFPNADTIFGYLPSDVFGTSNPYTIYFSNGYYYYSTWGASAAVRCVR